MTEYRRLCDFNGMQKLWHFHEACHAFPRRNFAIERAKPSDDEVCPQCVQASRDRGFSDATRLQL
jgi:hypothetical protein